MRFAFSALILTAAALSAQDPFPRGNVAGTAFGLWPSGQSAETLRGGGPGYRVDFDASGATYVPALPDAPQLYPMRFAFASLERSEDVIAQGHAVAPQASGDAVCYDRGHGFGRALSAGLDRDQAECLGRTPPRGPR